MKKEIIIFILLLNASILFGQNLVPNPSFEYYDNCVPVIDSPFLPTYFGLKDWFSPTMASPDFDNKCYSNSDSSFHVPQNAFGYQFPQLGNGYIDIDVFSKNPLQYREYIEVRLTDSLITDKKYCASFFVSLTDSSNYAVDKIGMYFSDTLISNPSIYHLQYNPQIFNPQGNFLMDKENWTIISGEYIAHGGEKFITIGNFFDDNNTDTIHVSGGSFYMQQEALYYIDDVSLYLCDDTIIPPNENTLTIPNAFTPNNDGINDIFKVKGQNIKTINAKIFNRWGQELFKWNDLNVGWDGKHNGQDVSAGVYFYLISITFENGEIQEEHGSIELIR